MSKKIRNKYVLVTPKGSTVSKSEKGARRSAQKHGITVTNNEEEMMLYFDDSGNVITPWS